MNLPTKYREIADPTGFINSEAFQIADFVGKKVILLEIFTYSCINCQRTFPYLNDFYKKCKVKGLQVLGIQTPEFDSEKNIENVKSALKEFGITFPVALDNNFATWNAYENQYWPHRYLIDLSGAIVYEHIGEGDYDGTEREIQKLLSLK